MKKHQKFWGLAAGAFVVQALIGTQVLHPQWVRNYMPKGQIGQGLTPDQTLLALAGFREMIASILWVRADSFFDQGDYDGVLPIIRLVTWLDPKQIDVYATGMWHIGYNFTDEQSRSDRRYIPSALQLGAEGAKNNPQTYEMFFETGWMWYHKINDNYENAVKWMEEAQKREDIIPARRNILAMAYQRNGDIESALKLYYDQHRKAQALLDKNKNDFAARQQRDTVEGNIDNTLVRMSQRGWFGNNTTGIKTDNEPAFDVGFGYQVTIPQPSQIRIRANWNVRPVGTRIKVILKDYDYPNAIPAGMKWDSANEVSLEPPKDVTYMQDDNLFFRNQRADKTIDLSRDPTMYPLVGEKYTLEFYYNPRSAPPHIQDKFSWSGEGMTAHPDVLNTSIRPGQRVIYGKLELSRDMIRRTGEWTDKTPRFEFNFREPALRDDDQAVIRVPGLLSGE